MLSGCAADPPGPQPVAAGNSVQRLKPEVIEVLPHDRTAFTEGFEMAGGMLYEGTGLVGQSSLRVTDPATGTVNRRVELPAPLFGEGITVVDRTVWQLTWREGIAVRRDRSTLAELGRVTYQGEGWGLCHDDASHRLVMSEGTDRLIFRDQETFKQTGELRVRSAGKPVTQLNELECVGGSVYANVWQTDTIVRIDAVSGEVTATVDAAGLLPRDQRGGVDVLNGIAAVEGTDEFLLTGKLWPSIFRVRFVPAN